jgi:hypothetical protein
VKPIITTLLSNGKDEFAGTAVAESVKRSFTFPQTLYDRLERIADKEDRTVNAQVVRWIEQKVREYEEREQRENEPGNWVPELLAA